MYDKFENTQHYLMSDKLYYEEFYVKKSIFVTHLFIPEIKRVIRIETHFGDLLQKDQFLSKRKQELRNQIVLPEYDETYAQDDLTDNEILQQSILSNNQQDCDFFQNTDLTEELAKYCPNPDKQQSYFYKKAFLKDEELPDYYTLQSDFAGTLNRKRRYSLNEQNLKSLSMQIRILIVDYIQEGKIKIDSLNHYIDFMSGCSSFLKRAVYFKENFLTSLSRIDASINEYNEPFFKVYCQDVMDSIFIHLKGDVAVRCEFCDRLIYKATKTKKYCSLPYENRDCGTKARNASQYKRDMAQVYSWFLLTYLYKIKSSFI